MDKYEEMIDMFYRNPRVRKWDRGVIYSWLKYLDAIGQLYERRVNGKLRFFLAWIRCTDEEKEIIRNNSNGTLLNKGHHICPLFMGATGIGFGFIRKVVRDLMSKLGENGELLSYRRGRFMTFGRKAWNG